MIRKLTATDNDIATTVLRLVLGVIFFAHGAQKMLGWFGGYGFTGTMGFFTGVLHIPAVFAFLAVAAEFFGGLGLIFGAVHPRGCLWGPVQHDRGHRDGSWSVRVLDELDWDTERRWF
jgi:uncharacterized membrane protein YphA (DoxX/SURF4 family)